MSQAKKFIMAGATFSVALGIGFAMQNGDAVAARFGSSEPSASTAPVAPEAMPAIEVVLRNTPKVGPVLMQPQIQTASFAIPATQPAIVIASPPVQLATLNTEEAGMTLPNVSSTVHPDALQAPVLAAAGDIALDPGSVGATRTSSELLAEVAPTVDCSPVMVGVAAPAAMVELTLEAPCSPSAEFVLHHQGMMITAVTDSTGHADLVVPALGTDAVFIAAFGDQLAAIATISVPEMAQFDRAVLQWQGEIGVQMQVYEFGAGFGDEGHVWAETPRDVAAVAAGQGFLIELGEKTALAAPYRAQVYTYPSGAGVKDGSIVIIAEAAITQSNCGRDITAQSIQVTPGQEPSGQDLAMTMPGCDGIGDFLMLNTMFDEFAVASN